MLLVFVLLGCLALSGLGLGSVVAWRDVVVLSLSSLASLAGPVGLFFGFRPSGCGISAGVGGLLLL